MTESLFAQFQRHLSALGGEVIYVDDVAQGAELIAERARQGDGSIVVPPIAAQLITPALWQQAIPLLREMGITVKESTGAASVADAPVGLSGAELAIAETGSLMLADNALQARVVSMLTLTHIVLISESAIVPMLDDAGARLRELTRAGANQRHYISLITSSSRTSDIERVLTIGVQGPKTLCVIVVKG
ncbi:MAG: lactate utilization protein [Ktedonobacteraceae bacterium]